MKTRDKKEVCQELKRIADREEHIDSRVFSAISMAEGLYEIYITDQDAFLSLIWQESDPVRFLTPKGQPRTLKDVTERFISKGYSFRALKVDSCTGQCDPEWFKVCEQLDDSFDIKRFGYVVIVQPNDNERNQSPRGSFYIYDGVHKTLVYAKRLLKRETKFELVRALLIIPRPVEQR